MDWLAFVASVIGSLAWPSVLLIIFMLLRKPLYGLLPLLQKLKYKEIEVEFTRRVEEVSAEVVQELPAPVPPVPLGGDDSESVARLAEISPRAAVLESWRSVEAAALEAARRLGGDKFRDKTLTFHAIRFLEQHPSLDRGVIGLLRELRALRNDAAHAPDFALSKASALEYGVSCNRVVAYLRQLASNA